ncbi:IS1 family transposase [Xenorhabdus entomophaga]
MASVYVHCPRCQFSLVYRHVFCTTKLGHFSEGVFILRWR